MDARSGSDLRNVWKGADGAAAAVPKRAPWCEPDAPRCHSRSSALSSLIQTSCKCDTLKGLFAAKLPSAFLSLLRADSRCSLCPGGWLWWRGCCYFFSVGLQENRRWNESAEFCQKHNSSLVVIKDSAEMVTRMWFCKWKQHVGGSGDVVNTTLVETKARSSGLQDTRVKITQRIRTVEM